MISIETNRVRRVRQASAITCVLAIACASACSDSELTREPSAETAQTIVTAVGAAVSPKSTCAGFLADPPDSTRKLLEGPLERLSPELKRCDFRLNPPPVESMFASPSPSGGTHVTVNFGPDPRLTGVSQLTLTPDEGRIVLSAVEASPPTLGPPSAGSPVAAGRSFAGDVPVPYADVLAGQQALRLGAADLKITDIPVFEGRDVVREYRLPPLNTTGPIPVSPTPGQFVHADRSLLVTDPSVVQDPARTYNPCTRKGTKLGPWTFGRLMTDMAGSVPATTFVKDWLAQALRKQTITRGLTVPGESILVDTSPLGLSDFLTDPTVWPRLNGDIDLSRAPFILLAIVNRIDLAANDSYGGLGGAEGRLIFQMVDNTCAPIDFTVIFEYGVPASTCSAMKSWAQAWEFLGTIPVSSALFNQGLQALTDQFAGAYANPGAPNGSALKQLRTNYQVAEGTWELREFHLSQQGTNPFSLNLATTAQTPADTYNGARIGSAIDPGPHASDLATWIETNVSGTENPFTPLYTVPLMPFGFQRPLLGGQAVNAGIYWDVTGPSDAVLHVFSLNTCSGCHGAETAVQFTQVSAGNDVGQPAQLSGFLRGATVPDPRPRRTGSYRYGDLARRAQVLEQFAGAFCGDVGRGIPPPLRGMTFPSPLPPIQVMPILASD